MIKRKPLVAAAASGLGIALSGCGNSGSSEPSKPADSPKPSASAQSTPGTSRSAESTEQAGSANSDSETAPGTALKFGQSATVAYASSKKPTDPDYYQVQMKATVTSLTQGKLEDFAQFKDSDKLAGKVPFYALVDYEVVSSKGKSLGLSTIGWKGYLGNGSEAQGLSKVGGNIPVCQSKFFGASDRDESDALKVGAKSNSCEIFLAPAGSTVDSVGWRGSFSSSDPRYKQYSAEPIKWTK